MSLKFCANLSFMFEECGPLLERYKAASKAGFKAVECAFPYEFPVKIIAAEKRAVGVEQILINTPPGDVKAGEFGFAAVPGKEKKFQETLELAIKYAKILNCQRIHILSGKTNAETEHAAMLSTFEKNLTLAAERLEKEGLVGVIEPINKISLPGYFLNNFDMGVSLVKKINRKSLRLQLDFFHLQHICGNLTNNVKEMLPYVGHIQIAQVPDRHEPNSSGEINYMYVFGLLKQLEYDGWIGLEYKPAAGTVEGLKWLQEFGYSLK